MAAMKSHPRLSPPEESLLDHWTVQLLADGWRPQSARRATNRIREFARAAPGGLLGATRANVYALFDRYREGPGTAIDDPTRGAGWRQTIATVRAFYRWGNSKGVGLGPDPTARLVLTPSRSPGVRIRPRDAKLYEAVLAAPGLSPRDQCILRLLAIGFDPAGVAALRLEEVNPEATWTVRNRTGAWVPLSDRGVLSVYRWLQVRPPGRSDFLFPGPTVGRGISASTVRDVVRRATRLAFPRPNQAALRRRIYPTGCRHLFAMRAIRARVSPAALRSLTQMDRLSRLEAYGVSMASQPQLRKEIARMERRWRNWL
jgi:hypothetical protein